MKKFFVTATFIAFIGAAGFLIYSLQKDLSLEDSGALLGGELERGYPSAGYLISYEPSGQFKTCGYSVLNSQVGITASHCVDNSSEIFLGRGDFSLNKDEHIEVTNAVQKEGWVQRQDRSQDFAILNFNDSSNFYDVFAQITSPVEGCNFRVVAYGRTEDPNETFTKPRKSGRMCAFNITPSTFMIRGDNAGICFGDSGSPLYYEGTDNVVGVIASIVLEDENNTNPCAIGNTAIVVRADNNQSLINENIASIADSLNSVSVTDGLTIEVADQTFLERFGLNNLTEEQTLTYILFGTGTLLVFMIMTILILFFQGDGKKQSETGYYV